MIGASICTIGDEILIGQIVDTNSAGIATELEKNGIKVRKMLSFADDKDEIRKNLDTELDESDIVIVTGGLGPTKDDVTKKVLFELSRSTRYVENTAQAEVIHEILASRGLDTLDTNRAQALVPDNCEVIVNRLGTAPVMVLHTERQGRKVSLYSLPGVPFEAMGAMDDVISDISLHYHTEDIYHKTVMTYGIAESALSDMLEKWEGALPDYIHLAYLPDPLKGVALRLSVFGGERLIQEARCERELAGLRKILGDSIYSEEGERLETVVGKLLKKCGKTLSTAESCTGGMIASLITSVPGSSDYFLGSVVSYANSVKHGVLGVSDEILKHSGAVSEECVRAMAEGVRKLTGSDYSVATSGIAGPGGGSEDKPVGLVWVGVSSEKRTEAVKFNFRNDRLRNTQRFAASALDTLRKFIESELNN